jgi:ribosomal protein L39E
MRLLKASLQARPLPAFVLEIVRVDVLVDFGGNLRKWRRQLEMLKGEVVRALELVEEELFE